MSLKKKIILGFAAVYLVWGSTYLAIRFAIETIPPFLMAGTRFIVASLILYAFARRRSGETPKPEHWRSTAIIGALLILGGNGGVTWAEQSVPSGLTALLVSTVPLWMTLLAWGLERPRQKLNIFVLMGLALGFLGVLFLVGPTQIASGGSVDLLGAGVLVAASLSWAIGSLYARRAKLPQSMLLATAMEMMTGGTWQVLASVLSGEYHRFSFTLLSWSSGLSYLYLVVFGSLVGFTAYSWLLQVSTPAKVSTYAYVNPAVAVLLGWALAAEPLTGRLAVASGLIITAVALITTFGTETT